MEDDIKEIIKRFTDVQSVKELSGGMHNVFKAGSLVFKPVLEKEKYNWISNVFENIDSDLILISRPKKSKNGNFIEAGYGATQYIPGEFYPYRIEEKLQAAIAFHKVVSLIEKPVDFDNWQGPWILSSQVAWKERDLPDNFDLQARQKLSRLLDKTNPISLPTQFIHSDLSGNILFQLTIPIIIDISPDFRPVEYAHTLLITDSIAWHKEPAESLKLLPFLSELRKQLVLRAVIFRLCVPLFFDYKNLNGFNVELDNFRSILKFEGLQCE